MLLSFDDCAFEIPQIAQGWFGDRMLMAALKVKAAVWAGCSCSRGWHGVTDWGPIVVAPGSWCRTFSRLGLNVMLQSDKAF